MTGFSPLKQVVEQSLYHKAVTVHIPIPLILGLMQAFVNPKVLLSTLKYLAIISLLRHRTVLHTVLPHFSVLNKGEYTGSSNFIMMSLTFMQSLCLLVLL